MSVIPGPLDEARGARVCLVAVTAVGQAVAAGAAAFATRDVFQALHQPGSDVPVSPLLVLLFAGVVIAALRISGRSLAERVGQDYVIALRHVLFAHLLRMPVGAVAGRRTGALAIRFVGDLAAARNWVGLGLARIVAALVVVPGSIIALVLLSPELAAAAAVPLALFIGVMFGVGATMPPVHRQLRSQRANLAIAVMERAPAAPELRLMGRGGSELEALRQSGSAVRRAAVARARRSELLRRLPEAGAAASAVSVLWLALNRDLPPAEAAGALAVLAILVQPLRDLATVWDYRCAWVIARDKIAALLSVPTLDPPDAEQVRPRKQPQERAPARLAFKRVHRGAVCELDAVAEPGMKVAIIGANGAGKSTCLALAAGLDAADGGAVELDGRDLAAMPVTERRRSIVFVGPRSPILKGSLRRALTLGVTPRPADAAIQQAALDHGLDAVLRRLGGLDGKVAEAGRNLSSGETLRLHLVRAALAKPRLLLLDEADRALDPDGAAAFRRLIRTTSATTLVATRDPILARQADVLWYMQSGRVCAAGSPGDLIEHVACVARWFRPRDAA